MCECNKGVSSPTKGSHSPADSSECGCSRFGPLCARGQALLEQFKRAAWTKNLGDIHTAYAAYAGHVEGEPGGDDSEGWYEYKSEQEAERAH